MRVRSARRLTVGLTALAVFAGAAPAAGAGDLTVTVLDRDGRGIAGVVVELAAHSPPKLAVPGAPRPPAEMDQRGLAFVPQVLAIAAGTEVRFPNSDDINHQVYSFSKAKTFQLPLYKGRSQPPVLFERPGVVVLGCNIHDEMLGYIYVAQGPDFGLTAADGALTLPAVADGAYRLSIWSPRISDPSASLARGLSVGRGSRAVEFRLTRALRAPPPPRPPRSDADY